MEITVMHYHMVSIVLFSIGIFGVLAQRHLISILMSIMMMFIAASINFAAVNAYGNIPEVYGQAWVIMVLGVMGAEMIVGLFLILALFRSRNIIFADEMHSIKE